MRIHIAIIPGVVGNKIELSAQELQSLLENSFCKGWDDGYAQGHADGYNRNAGIATAPRSEDCDGGNDELPQPKVMFF